MAALNGSIDEWTQDKDGRWYRPGHPEDGVITITPGAKYVDFADYYAKRAEPEPPPDPDPRDVKIADLETRLAKLEAKAVAAPTGK